MWSCGINEVVNNTMALCLLTPLNQALADIISTERMFLPGTVFLMCVLKPDRNNRKGNFESDGGFFWMLICFRVLFTVGKY